MRRVAWLAAAAALAAVTAASLVIAYAHRGSGSRATAASAATNELFSDNNAPAPPLAGATLGTAGRVSLGTYRGRVVIVSFFASWCAPCRQEAPDLRRFALSHPRVVVLSVDYQDTASAAVAFIRSQGFTWPVIRDASGSIGTAWRVGALPETFAVRADGRIAAVKFGAATSRDLVSMISL